MLESEPGPTSDRGSGKKVSESEPNPASDKRAKKEPAESEPATSKQNLLTEPHTFYYNKRENR
ncbi:hypothetical protein ABE25_01285 [Cytobacillus firmus]|nr:hypothetical protein [Cytobacillus firmus]MBG9600904.1 hypothetical protein [Cytobacillus firmus]MBG9658051.1 hypothetical protein [Cytobacillus firmus]